MAEINPPTYEQNACYTARDDRLVAASLVCAEGVSDGLDVSNAAGMNVSVSAGSAFIEGDQVALQGMYHVANDAAVTVPLAASDPTDARVDLIIARVYDSQYSGVTDAWALEAVTGTPSPAPSPGTLPDNAIVLAEVTVPAGSTGANLSINTDVQQLMQLCGLERNGVIDTFASAWPVVSGLVEQRGVTVFPSGTFSRISSNASVTGSFTQIAQMPSEFSPLFNREGMFVNNVGQPFQYRIAAGGGIFIRSQMGTQIWAANSFAYLENFGPWPVS